MSARITKEDVQRAIYLTNEDIPSVDSQLKEAQKKLLLFGLENDVPDTDPTWWDLLKSPKFWLKVLKFFLANYREIIGAYKLLKK